LITAKPEYAWGLKSLDRVRSFFTRVSRQPAWRRNKMDRKRKTTLVFTLFAPAGISQGDIGFLGEGL
jgi:hypothetical protein